MGRCLFGIGIGHAAAVLMLSRLRVGVKGWGEEDRVWPAGIGRGRAMVAIVSIYLTIPVVEQEQRPGSSSICNVGQHIRSYRSGRSYPEEQCVEECNACA